MIKPHPISCFLLSALSLLPFSLSAQKSKLKEPEHKLIFNIKDCNEEKMFLTIQFKEKYMLKDSAFNTGKGVFVFEGDEKYDEGMYSLISGSKKPMMDFIMDGTQKFTYNLDTTGDVRNFSVIGSPENALMLRFQQKAVDARKKMMEWSKKRKEFEENGMKDSLDFYTEKMKSMDGEMEHFITGLIEENPTFLFSKLQKSFRDIEIPDPPVYEDGSIDSSFRAVYFRTHYWDNYDLTDRRFLFMPKYDKKLSEYFTKVLWYQDRDTINKYMDMMLEKTRPDSLMYRYLIEFLSKEFESSKMIDHDAVFVHLAKNNQLAGKCTWMDEDLIKKYSMRIEDLEPMLIGNRSVEMIIPDTTQSDIAHWYSSYKMPKKYRILWFYDHKCSHCHKESKELKAVYDSLANIGELNFDVYAVNQTEDIEGWKKYIRDNGYTWINVGGTKGNVDWKKEYHIASNPQFYIINQEKIIILNKNISKDLIPQFLRDYERIEAEKARLKNKKQ
jgi:thioredoxin-related protein